jgi:hypothetical protein
MSTQTVLGFIVGPGKGQESWKKPLIKYKDRIARWAPLGGGMQIGALTYNTFALSTLLYVGQLERIPEEVSAAELKCVMQMFPGPGNWILPSDAWYLKESFGLAMSAQPLDALVKAAQLRVATLGCHFERKHIHARDLRRLSQDNIFARVHELHSCMKNTDHLDRIVT